jgi:hypothetical protein
MFQLIVSVIAIALVAILAAASIYYGGDAFSNSTAKGNVAALINAGQQIAGANSLYTVDQTVSASTISGLIPTYLSAIPTAPRVAAGTWSLDAGSTVAYIGLSTTAAQQVCTEVGNEGGAPLTPLFGAEPTAGNFPSNQFGCVGGGVGGNVPVWFAYKL